MQRTAVCVAGLTLPLEALAELSHLARVSFHSGAGTANAWPVKINRAIE